jgi:hypothetical protein
VSKTPRSSDESPKLDPDTMVKLLVKAAEKLHAEEASETQLPDRLPDDIYDPGWMRLASSGYGASLEAIWHTTWRVIGVTIALISDEQPPEAYQRIPYRKVMPKIQIVEVVAGILERKVRSKAAMNVLVQLGPDAGHAITMVDADRPARLIIFEDPINMRSPNARSLLCEGNNSIGIAARPASGRPGAWTVTFDEFQKALVAAYVVPAAYADITGVAYKRSLQSVLQGEFGSFFRLRVVKQTPGGEASQTVDARLGAHENEIHLQFEIDPSGDIQRATIGVARSMLEGQDLGLALDAIKSFLGGVIPMPDEEEARFLADAIWKTRLGVEVAAADLDQGPVHLVHQVRELWECLVGKRQTGYLWLALTTIASANVNQGGHWWFRLLVALSELEGGYMFGPEDAAALQL